MKKLFFLAMFVTVTCVAIAQNANDSIKVTTKTTTELEKEYNATGTRTLSTGIQKDEPTEVNLDFGDISHADSLYTLRLKGVPVRYHAKQNNDTCYVAFNTDYNEIVRIIFTTDDRTKSPRVNWDGVMVTMKSGNKLSIKYEAEHPIEK